MPYTANERRYEAMQYARCGKSGLKLPRVSLGLWHNFGSCDAFDNMRAMLRAAFDCGITHIDMANNYGPVPGAAEENFGRIFEKDLRPYRDELVLSSKAGYTMWPGPYGDFGSRKYLLASLDQSLKRTGLEYFDIFYSHRMDPETPLEETMGALASAVQQGKALYAGISNYDGETTARAAAILKELHCPFIINQSRYSIFDRTIEKNGLKAYAAAHGVGVIAFSPLAQGLLTDKYLHGVPADSRIKKSGVFEGERPYAGAAGTDRGAERAGCRPGADAGADGAFVGAQGQRRDQRAHWRVPYAADRGERRHSKRRAVYPAGAGRDRTHRCGAVSGCEGKERSGHVVLAAQRGVYGKRRPTALRRAHSTGAGRYRL